MKSQLLDIYIFELLVKHNCVIVPNFGGFISNYKSAYYNEIKQVYFPASRAISFNKNLLNNDGLLIQAYAKENEITLLEAEIEVEKAVANYKSELEQNKRVSFNKIGVLFYDSNAKLQFSPDLNQNFQENSFGFTPQFALQHNLVEALGSADNQNKEKVVIEQIAEVTAITKDEVSNVEEVKADEPEKPETKVIPLYAKLAKVASVAAIFLVVLGSVFWFSNSETTGRIQNFNLSTLIPDSSIFSVNTNEKPQSYSPSEKISIDHNTVEVADINVLSKAIELNQGSAFKFDFENNKISDEAGIWVKADYSSKTFEIDNKSGYFLVAGCFSTVENAEKLIAQLSKKGFSSAHVFDFENGLYRVSFSAPYNSYLEAKNELKKIQATENSGAWIARK
jgi:hypothetical protein